MLQLVAQSDEIPNVIMVDDSSVILTDGLVITNVVFLTAYPDYSWNETEPLPNSLHIKIRSEERNV